MKKILIIIFAVISIITWNCEPEKPVNKERIVIGVAADVENLNPLYAFGLLEGNIREILFLSLVKHQWVEEIGDLDTSPLLAEKWEWNQDSTSVTFYLRENLFWSDGTKLTVENQQIDIKKTFKIISPAIIKVNFKPGSKPSLFDVDMPILPKHVFSKIPRKDLSTT